MGGGFRTDVHTGEGSDGEVGVNPERKPAEVAGVTARRAVPAITLALATTLLIATAPHAQATGGADDTREPAVTVSPARPLVLGAPPRALSTTLTPEAFTQALTTTLTTTATTSRYLGPALSGIVIDPSDGTVLWRHNDGRARMPASNQKLLTTYTVLHSMKPTDTLLTRACQSDATPWAIYLRGGGDPSLSWARIETMAVRTAAALKQQRRTTIALYVDGSLFPEPTPAPGWTAAYLREDVQRVRGLALAGYRGADSRLAVGQLLAASLKKKGITAAVRGPAVTPRRCTDLASSPSAPVSRLLTTMLAVSNNDYAEFLLRHAALARGYAPSWRGALDNELQLLARANVPTAGLRVVDGSGLSRANRMPVATLAAVLRLLREDPADAAIVFAWGALPRAGQTGTLAKRFQAPNHACARGQVTAKTGTLSDAVALTGVARGADGRDRVFVFLENGLVGRNTSVRAAVDTMATTVVGCRLG